VEYRTVIRKTILARLSVAALCAGGILASNVAQAFDFGNMMNPSRWFDNDRHYDRDYYRYGGPYGYGPYGGGWGGPYGYGPYGGWGGPYGYGGYGGPYGGYGGGYPSTIVVNPGSDSGNDAPPPAPPPRLPE
jgi:hypothetical protein